MDKPLCCPALALSARAVHGSQGQGVLSPKGSTNTQFGSRLDILSMFEKWATSTPEHHPPCLLHGPRSSQWQYSSSRIVFQLGSLFPVGSYYLFVFTEATPYLLATWSLMSYYPKLIFSFKFRNKIVWFVWRLLLPFTVATVCWKLHCIMTSPFSD